MKEHSIRTRVIEVTPGWAEKKLGELQRLVEEGIFRNRSINKPLVNSYASDMVRGRWGLSHQGIAFDEDGRLIDGQHRLWAVVKAGIPVTMTVTTGVPVSTDGGFSMPTMDIVDRGKNRSIGQQLNISHGVVGASQVAAVVRNIAYVYTNDKDIKLSITQTLEMLNMYQSDIESLFALTTHGKQRIGPIFGPIAVYHKSEPAKAKEFAAQLITKENLPKGSPALALIKWLELHPGFGGKDTVFQKLRTVSYCLHQHHHDQQAETASPKEDAMYWLAALNKKHGEIIRGMIYPLRNK